MKKITFIILLFIASNFLILAEPIEARILRTIHTERNKNLDDFMKLSSNSTYIILPSIPIGLFISSQIQDDKQQFYTSVEMASSVVISGGTAYLLKQIFARQRPFNKYDFIENICNESGYSFPSQHAATSFALATSVSLAYPK
jgi:membrane-associated phospholipid phosphatase